MPGSSPQCSDDCAPLRPEPGGRGQSSPGLPIADARHTGVLGLLAGGSAPPPAAERQPDSDQSEHKEGDREPCRHQFKSLVCEQAVRRHGIPLRSDAPRMPCGWIEMGGGLEAWRDGWDDLGGHRLCDVRHGCTSTELARVGRGEQHRPVTVQLLLVRRPPQSGRPRHRLRGLREYRLHRGLAMPRGHGHVIPPPGLRSADPTGSAGRYRASLLPRQGRHRTGRRSPGGRRA